MKYAKQAKTAYLFREIGGIDDRLVQEAMLYRPRKILPQFFLIAACITLSLALSVGAFLISMRGDKKDESNRNDGDLAYTDGTVAPTLDKILSEADAYTTVASAEALDYFSGNAYVVWQHTDSDEVYVSRVLTDRELEKLTKEIGNGKAVGAQETELTSRVWIVVGDGSVLSPYLKPSDGNIGSAELFDYNAELIPSDSFNSQISEILN
ncbi:MAG: hypothetical protein IJW55_01750 [Clostridia bacterium]|nr:hypothetical protein [Clostridia bacterium]